jgi:hypothetical protein
LKGWLQTEMFLKGWLQTEMILKGWLQTEMILKGWLQTEMIVKVLAPGRFRRNDLEGLALEMYLEDYLPLVIYRKAISRLI